MNAAQPSNNVPITVGPQMAMPQQQAPQQPMPPGNNIMAPTMNAAAPSNNMPIQAGPQMDMQPPPQPQPPSGAPAQPGLGAGTPFRGGFNPLTTDWALPSNRGMMPGNIQPGLSGGTPFPFSGGMGGGFADMGGGGFGGGGMGGGEGGGMGGGGGGGGGKVDLSGAMKMIPKPIPLTPAEQFVQPIKVTGHIIPPMQQTEDPNPFGRSLAKDIMDFLQG